MNKIKNSQIIIALLLFSIVAVITMQLFWLAQSYQLNRENQKSLIQSTIKENFDEIRIKMYFNLDITNSNIGLEDLNLLKSISRLLADPSSATKNVSFKLGKIPAEDRIFDEKNALKQSYKTYNFTQVSPNITVPKDPAVVLNIIDSLFKKNFDSLHIKNDFKVYMVPKSDTLKIENKLKNEFIWQKGVVLDGYTSYVTVRPHFLATLSDFIWLFSISILILFMLFFAAISLIKSFNREKQLAEIKNDFLSNITHEFKTPISTVTLAIEMIKNFGIKKDPNKLDEYLDICSGELKRVSTMIETVLRLAQEKAYILQKEEIDLQQILEKFKSQAKPLLEENDAQIEISLSKDFPRIFVDSIHLENILYNLLDNSIKYSKGKLRVNINVTNKTNFFKISFSDNGIGIPKSYIDNIFDNFFRVPTGNLHSNKGYGLGLSYVKKIIDLHGGEIIVDSKIDHGTTFHLVLPLNHNL